MIRTSYVILCVPDIHPHHGFSGFPRFSRIFPMDMSSSTKSFPVPLCVLPVHHQHPSPSIWLAFGFPSTPSPCSAVGPNLLVHRSPFFSFFFFFIFHDQIYTTAMRPACATSRLGFCTPSAPAWPSVLTCLYAVPPFFSCFLLHFSRSALHDGRMSGLGLLTASADGATRLCHIVVGLSHRSALRPICLAVATGYKRRASFPSPPLTTMAKPARSQSSKSASSKSSQSRHASQSGSAPKKLKGSSRSQASSAPGDSDSDSESIVHQPRPATKNASDVDVVSVHSDSESVSDVDPEKALGTFFFFLLLSTKTNSHYRKREANVAFAHLLILQVRHHD
jgi:hypothetical protein